MLPTRDSPLGTLVGLIAVGIAIGGSVLFDWQWGWNPNQPVPLVLGVIAAIAAIGVTISLIRN
jgi:CHASE2 domain-containing sensor protein